MNDSDRRLVNRRKAIWTVIAIIAAAGALSGFVDATGQRYAGEAFTRALVTFAVARTLNGVISVAQGTEVAVEPGGVGVNFTVGEVLDPINDLVERFSAVMLVATSSLGLQNVLLKMTMWWGTSLAVALAALISLVVLWWPKFRSGKTQHVVINILLVTVFLRFAVPLLVIGSNLVFDTFLASEQTAATAALEATRTQIEELNDEAAAQEAANEDQSVIERLGTMLDNSLESMNVSDRLQGLSERVSNASEHIINLIVIFTLQTILLPLVFLWLIVELLKLMASRATFRH
jgi:hypothetical protein